MSLAVVGAAVVAGLTTAVVPVGAAPAGPDTNTPLGAVESEVLALVELGAFPTDALPPAVRAVHAQHRGALAGLSRESLLTWLGAADRAGVAALERMDPAAKLSRDVVTVLSALPDTATESLRRGGAAGVPVSLYDHALNDLSLRGGAPLSVPPTSAAMGASTPGGPAVGAPPASAAVEIPGVRPTFGSAPATSSSAAPPAPPPAVPASDSRAMAVVLVAAVAAVAIAGALLVVGRRRREALAELSLTDDLTELGNRRRLERDLDAALGAAGARVGFVMLDIDHFKHFNDSHGHLAGDDVLRDVADILRAAVRSSDVVYRYGGEEFCVLLPDADPDEARAVAERLRAAIEAHAFPGEEDQPGGCLTISVGMTLRHVTDAQSIKRCADDALYEAKRAGRNRVVVHAADAP